MKVYIYGDGEDAQKLNNAISSSLEDLGLSTLIEIENTNDEAFAEEMKITKTPAFVIEEESINFKDVIFEGIVPEDAEIKNMFMSIIGDTGGAAGGCGPSGCGTCTAC